jgi:hypothetical protein
VIFARPFRDVIGRQLDLFVQENAALVRDCEAALARYDAADRAEAEELYGHYLDLVETATEVLADMRDRYAATLDEREAERYREAFNRAVGRQLRAFALELEDR